MSERTSFGDAADLAARECVRSERHVGFAMLEDPTTHETVAIVLVCLDPSLVERVLGFVYSLGNFHTRAVTKEGTPR